MAAASLPTLPREGDIAMKGDPGTAARCFEAGDVEWQERRQRQGALRNVTGAGPITMGVVRNAARQRPG